MTYSATGVLATSDARHTAQGARDLATAYIVAGMQEVGIRDSNGNLRSVRELDETHPLGPNDSDPAL